MGEGSSKVDYPRASYQLNLALNKCHENVTICVLKLVFDDCFFVSINVATGVSLVNIKLLPSSTSNNIKYFRYGFI